ncbi:MAG TPA: entericidin A/B family lipoprotein [Terricaulis sp.]|nr:entericidin A/B family lipoprotein [Terricaulis sp.]
MSKSISPLIALAALAGVLTLGACNTVRGAGEDLQQAGEHVEERAEDLNDGNPRTP